MVINIELFKAILAMDSYNRGYKASIDVSGTQIGNATVFKESDITPNSVEVTAGFYAISYKLTSGETVISYRGTDKNFSFPFWPDVGSDMWNGYGTGTGSPTSLQAKLALQFYKAVASSLGATPKAANISLTGHSLGGGLAGYIGSLYGKNGTLFDNMAFEKASSVAHDAALDPVKYASVYGNQGTAAYNAALAVANTLKSEIYGTATPWAINRAGLKTYYTKGEFLTPNRSLQATPQVGYDLGDNVDLNLLDAFKLHSMATLVIRMFADSLTSQDWRAAAKYFMPALYSKTIAEKAGAKSVTGTSNTTGDYASILQTTIAYSALDTNTVFGDTGIRALFNDANEWGKVLKSTTISEVAKDFAGSVSNIFTQFAGKLAIDKVLQSASSTAIDGVLKLSTGGEKLDIDLANKLWGTNPKIDGRGHLFAQVLTAAGGYQAMTSIQATMKQLWGSSSADIFDNITIATKSSGGTFTLSKAPSATTKANLFVGSLGDDDVTGSAGNDLLLGYDGIDFLNGGAGKDIVIGGKGFDILNGGDGNDILIGGGDSDGLTGGLGADKFVINNGDGSDGISDAEAGDRIIYNGKVIEGTATALENAEYKIAGVVLHRIGTDAYITSGDGASAISVANFFPFIPVLDTGSSRAGNPANDNFISHDRAKVA